MRHLLFVILLFSLSGCARVQPPDTAARVRHWDEALHHSDPKMRKEAAFKLGNLGLTDPGTVVPTLTAALKDADADVRCDVILALLKCGPAAKEAIPKLTDLQENDTDEKVRDHAAQALAKLREVS